jgi:transcriptional regulator with XRE-family HTH domain
VKLERLKEWREARGWTQKELSYAAGVGEKTIARIELGDSVRPSTARKAADALGVAVVDLMEQPPVPLDEVEALQETRHLEEEALETHSRKDSKRWESLLASVHERQSDVEAKVEELVELPRSEVNPYRVQAALDEAQECAGILLLAQPGSRTQHSRGREEIVIDLSAVDPDQWVEWVNAKRFYDGIVETLVEAGLVELQERAGQIPEPVPLGFGG